jgi:uncharacterized protein
MTQADVTGAVVMSVSARERTIATSPSSTHPGRHRPSAIASTTIAAGVCLAALVGVDGSPLGRAVRVLGIAVFTSLLAVVVSHAPLRWRGAVAASVAVPVLAIGVGFLPHVGKGGALVVQAASIALVAAALGLFVEGVVLLTRGRSLLAHVVTGGGLLTAAAVVVLVVAPAVAATNVPRTEIGAGPDSVGLDHEDVVLRTDDDVALAAWYVPSANRAAVALLHGAGSTRSDVLDEAAMLAGAGFGVLMVDARGHGDSGGRAMDFGWYGDSDVAAATAFLAARPDVDPERIGVVGLSMGAEEALGAIGSDDVIRAVVAEGATARSAPDDDWLSDVHGLRGLVQEQLERVQDWVTDALTGASPPGSLRSSVAAASGTRVLLITAGEVADESHAAEYIAAAAPDRVAIWNVAGAGHTEALAHAPHEWVTRVIGFLTESLLATGR